MVTDVGFSLVSRPPPFLQCVRGDSICWASPALVLGMRRESQGSSGQGPNVPAQVQAQLTFPHRRGSPEPSPKDSHPVGVGAWLLALWGGG